MDKVYLLMEITPEECAYVVISAHKTQGGAIAACDKIAPGILWQRVEDGLFGTRKIDFTSYSIQEREVYA